VSKTFLIQEAHRTVYELTNSCELNEETKAVLCDIDGTLVRSNWLHASAWKDAFAQLNIDRPLEDLRDDKLGKEGMN
jgi:predicted HAD superfamily phosphohydrolase YqeG